MVAPAAGVAEGSPAELVRDSDNRDSASWAAEAEDIPEFCPSSSDPIQPTILETPREGGPAEGVTPSRARSSWWGVVAEEGERISYGSAVGAPRATGVEVQECRAAGNPCRSLTLAVSRVENSNVPAARFLTGSSVDSCSIAHRLDRLCLHGASAPLSVPGYRSFRPLIWPGMGSQFLARVPRDWSRHSRRRTMGRLSEPDLRAPLSPADSDGIAKAMAMKLFSGRGRSYWNVPRMIDVAMSFSLVHFW